MCPTWSCREKLKQENTLIVWSQLLKVPKHLGFQYSTILYPKIKLFISSTYNYFQLWVSRDDLMSLQFQSHPGMFQYFSFTGVTVTKTWFEVNNLVSEPTAGFTGTPPQFPKSGSTLKHLNKCLIFWSMGKFYQKIKFIQKRGDSSICSATVKWGPEVAQEICNQSWYQAAKSSRHLTPKCLRHPLFYQCVF